VAGRPSEDEPIAVSRPGIALEAEIARARTTSGFTGKRFETLFVASRDWAATPPTIVLLGAGLVARLRTGADSDRPRQNVA
jgi:hypothetical protein